MAMLSSLMNCLLLVSVSAFIAERTNSSRPQGCAATHTGPRRHRSRCLQCRERLCGRRQKAEIKAI